MKHTLFLIILFSSIIASAQTFQPKLAFTIPDSMGTDLQYVPDGSNRLVVIQQLGRSYIFENKANPTYKKFLDLQDLVTQSGGELGFLGLTFHPNFTQNGYLFVNYTKNFGNRWLSCISRFQVSGPNRDTVLRSTEKSILQVYQPYPNHNGGWIAFGPDGYLYTSLGDGGSGGDPQNRAQNTDSLHGKILRLDVDNGDPYSIPPSNPFALNGGRPEIYAYGLRNAWRCSFDPVTRKLWAGDVGQNNYEEIDTIISGGNYGWNVKEGYHCFPTSVSVCDSAGFQSPVWEYSHGVGYSITGGYVYRGSMMPALVGKYVYADYNGKVWALTYAGLPLTQNAFLFNLGTNISSFGVDRNNELYVIGYNKSNLRIHLLEQVGGSVKAAPFGQSLNVCPNPAIDVLRVETSFRGKVQIEIIDVTGRVIVTEESDDLELFHLVSLKGFHNGIYCMVVRSDLGSQTRKFIVLR
jgi:glucose/arabinose dehydrogenase